MIAKFEKRILANTGNTSVCKYKSLQNLPHWHMEHEIIFVYRGSVELNVNNKLYILTPGMCAFIKSEEVHYIKGTPDSITHVIKTSASMLRQIIQRKQLESPVLKNNYSAETVFSHIADELKNPKEYNGIIADSIMTRFIAEIFRTEATTDSEAILKPNKKHKQLLEWITNNYTHITFDDAAGYMNFSRPYFSKYFQNLTGMKFTRYLNILKVSAAIEKITEGEKNMTEVSISCGFGTIRNFNRIFKSLTGYTPKSLPDDYIFLYTIMNGEGSGFDPTLNCSQIID